MIKLIKQATHIALGLVLSTVEVALLECLALVCDEVSSAVCLLLCHLHLINHGGSNKQVHFSAISRCNEQYASMQLSDTKVTNTLF
ncbi:hypothetical protein M8J76_013212 [Diaphorina citri]|nr:hypothetical protein M8J76_013212 [Diaphorina citri]